jgi:hypothetical protein
MAAVVATGHMAKALEKFTSWVGFLPYAWAEPTGLQTALEMNSRVLPQPAAWFGMSTLSVAAMSLVALGIYLALREACLANPEQRKHHFPAIALFGGFYLFLVCGWGG